jgi:hypothetical protein
MNTTTTEPSAQQTTEQAITDPLFVALLMFLSGDNTRTGINRLISVADDAARQMLASYPLHTAFGENARRPRPSLYELIAAASQRSLDKEAKRGGRPDPAWQIQDQQAAAAVRHVNSGAWNFEEPVTIAAHNLHSILIGYAEVGTFCGAALMYRLLKGGAQ